MLLCTYAFVSMAAGSIKNVCRCMFTCSEGEVAKGKDKKVRALSATACCSLLIQAFLSCFSTSVLVTHCK